MGSTCHRWLEPALRTQALGASVTIAGFIGIAALGLSFSLPLQISILLFGIVLVGFPHGAFDHLVARPILAPRLGQFWWVPFGLCYLGLAGLVWLAWMLAPALTLLLFLAGSVLHFGLGDTDNQLSSQDVPRWATVLTYGMLPILLPVAFHPMQAAPLLAAIADVAEPVMRSVLSRLFFLVPIWGVACVWVCWRAPLPIADFVLFLITVGGFVMLPPLLAFGLYFGLIHAPRHLLRLGAWHDPNNRGRAFIWLAYVVVPASLACAFGLTLIACTVHDVSIGLLVLTFRIIAALTLPHMIVTSWLGRRAR
jgi:Brp/Blh family beta-carotene 15,15'-monooxygenase